jgi:hypothetical protein
MVKESLEGEISIAKILFDNFKGRWKSFFCFFCKLLPKKELTNTWKYME